MKAELVRSLTSTFEAHAQQTESGVDFWRARDLQHPLGYAKWGNFLNVVSKAKTVSDREVDHFADVGEMVDSGSGSQCEVGDMVLTSREGVLASESALLREHVTNNEAVRKTLLDRGNRPESLPGAEDVKKAERRLASEEKKSLKNPDALDS